MAEDNEDLAHALADVFEDCLHSWANAAIEDTARVALRKARRFMRTMGGMLVETRLLGSLMMAQRTPRAANMAEENVEPSGKAGRPFPFPEDIVCTVESFRTDLFGMCCSGCA